MGVTTSNDEEEIREYSTRSSDFRTDVNLEASTQEECESIGGIWNEERSVCYKDCDKDDDRENISNETDDEESEERPADESDSSDSEDQQR